MMQCFVSSDAATLSTSWCDLHISWVLVLYNGNRMRGNVISNTYKHALGNTI